MTETWLEQNFPFNGTLVIVYQNDDSSVGISPAELVSMTTGTSNPPTYAELNAIGLTNWEYIFQQWKADGKIQ